MDAYVVFLLIVMALVVTTVVSFRLRHRAEKNRGETGETESIDDIQIEIVNK